MIDDDDKPPRKNSGDFKPGNTLGKGRPVGAKNKPDDDSKVSVAAARINLQGNFIRALARDFAKNGKAAIRRARVHDPMGYVKCVAQLMPKQMEATTPLEELSDAELTAGIAILRTRLTNGAGTGKQPAPLSKSIN